MVQFIEQIYHI